MVMRAVRRNIDADGLVKAGPKRTFVLLKAVEMVLHYKNWLA